MIGLGLGVNKRRFTGGFSAEYQAVYNSFTTKPSASVAAAQDAMVIALVAAGVWAKMDVFYLFAQESNGDGEALKNWFNPGTFDSTLVNAPVHVSLEGFTSNGTTSYINSNYNPNTNKINLALDSASLGVYSRTNIQEATTTIVLKMGTDNFQLVLRNATDKVAQRINASGGTAAANANSSGLIIGNRVLSTHQDAYRNGGLISNDSRPSVAIPSGDCFILARNLDGGADGFALHQVSMAFIGGGLTPTNITDLTK